MAEETRSNRERLTSPPKMRLTEIAVHEMAGDRWPIRA
jgi:hypothetical protein